MYIELPDLESFVDEIRYRKLKEIRLTPLYQQIPATPVSFTAISVILTAADGETIIKYTELIGRDASIFKDKIDEIGAKAQDFIKKTIHSFLALKVNVRKGIYKYPSEMS